MVVPIVRVLVTCCVALDALVFPTAGYGNIRQNTLFCRFPHCKRCATAGETATIHIDCFYLYTRRATSPNKLYRLWFASLGRYPWPSSPALLLPSKLESARASHLAADIYGLKRLAGLPREISTMVWNLLGSNDLLRLSAVLEIVDFLSQSRTDFDKSISIPLHRIQAWRRGSSPIISTDISHSLIELTIDSKGIKSIERLSSLTYKPRSQYIVYMVIRANQNLILNFQVSLLYSLIVL